MNQTTNVEFISPAIGTTTLYVTDDPEEALRLSDLVALMCGGSIVELDTPRALYLSPEKEFRERFIGQRNIWDCAIRELREGTAVVDSEIGTVIAKVGRLLPNRLA